MFSMGVSSLVFRNCTRHVSFRGIEIVSRRYKTDIGTIKQESDSYDQDESSSTTGVVDLNQRQILMYYDHIYSSLIPSFYIRKYLGGLLPNRDEESKQKVLDYSTSKQNPLPEDVRILEFIPLRRDGGVFVKFAVPQDYTPKQLIQLIMGNVKHHVAQYETNSFFRLYNRRFPVVPFCYEVKGTPWIEDLQRFPSPIITVKFEGESLTEEELYLLFRRYGLIIDIVVSEGDTRIIYRNFRSATVAKNCISGITVNHGKTTLHLRYRRVNKVNIIGEFISNHQRIAIPIIVALVAGAAVLIFDPIRQFFIEEKINHRFSFATYRDNKYLKAFLWPFTSLGSLFSDSYDFIGEKLNEQCLEDVISNESDLDGDSDDAGTANILWSERREKVKQIKLWIMENINTFIIISGPKGSGKRELVMDETLLADPALRRKTLLIDCDEIIKSRTDAKLIENTAGQIGYYPVFSWLNSASQLIDLGVQSLTGQKSGLSESKETQIKNMFLLASQAVKNVALNEYGSYKREMTRRIKRKERNKPSVNSEIEVDEIMGEDEYLQNHPEVKPIIVINKFLSKADVNEFVFKMISDWTANLVQTNLAHVIFITDDLGSIQQLNQTLPTHVFKTVTLSDATENSSFQFVMNQLKSVTKYEKYDSKLIAECLRPLGGRMLDLQSFTRRVKSGETPRQALNELISQAAEQITTYFLLNRTKTGDTDFKEWSPNQVWTLVKVLADKDTVEFNELVKMPTFKNNSDTISTLISLEKNDLIMLKRDKGVLRHISIGRPLYRAAFKSILGNKPLYENFEMNYFNYLIELESAKITKLETELSRVDFVNLGVKGRMKYLVDNIEVLNTKILQWEKKIAHLKSPPTKKWFQI